MIGMKSAGPTAVMRMEHRRMDAILDELPAMVRRSIEPTVLTQQAGSLSTLIASHDRKEQDILYPMMDRAFGEARGSTLLARTSLAGRAQ